MGRKFIEVKYSRVDDCDHASHKDFAWRKQKSCIIINIVCSKIRVVKFELCEGFSAHFNIWVGRINILTQYLSIRQ